MSTASNTEEAGTQRTDGDDVSLQQNVEAIEGRLLRLSQSINLCKSVLNDLKDLSDVVVRKSLQDVSLPPKE